MRILWLNVASFHEPCREGRDRFHPVRFNAEEVATRVDAVEGVPTFIEWFMALIRVHSLEVPPTQEPTTKHAVRAPKSRPKRDEDGVGSSSSWKEHDRGRTGSAAHGECPVPRFALPPPESR
jgi:hypothetical protein